jgi:HlyD family secretion protein
VNRNLDVLARIAESLAVRAPVDGQLSSLSAEVGQSFQRGARIGQIDQLDSFKVQADVDQYYISKVALGQTGKFEMDGRRYRLQVSKVYPEVAKDVFQVDMLFVGDVPPGIRRGQRLQIDLSLSESRVTNIIEKGGFYRHSNGRWAYRVAEDGRSARRTNVVFGRENPQSVEVIDGLEVGDWVITSSYEGLNDVDELKLGDDVINSTGSGPHRDKSR